MSQRTRAALVDVAGLAAMMLVLLDYLRPTLLLLPTITAGRKSRHSATSVG